ncbi:MAG: 2OG-Fe(II) oxygenase [Sneathiella sp.]|nr:2OG-Fe(II) oxygenase [Sneathiella sp.]
MDIKTIVNTENYPLSDQEFQSACHQTLNRTGVIVMRHFLKPEIVELIRREGEDKKHRAYFCRQEHNVYLTPSDEDYPADHTRNRLVVSSKGCITDDVIPANSPLRTLYDSEVFRDFLCRVLDETSLYEYADPLSSINLHYAETGQELGWHFDNSSFAITLMIQEPEEGGAFEYVGGMRDADKGEMNFEGVEKILNGDIRPEKLKMDAGTLVLFRGRNAIHRVAPVEGSRTRMLTVLAYNSEPGIALSESARMTFFGRLE